MCRPNRVKIPKDKLTDDLLGIVHLTGARFDRMLKRLAGQPH